MNDTVRHLSCGCCDHGCCCQIHADIPLGLPPRMCEACAPLPFAPLDRIYRYDARLGKYVRKPQGQR